MTPGDSQPKLFANQAGKNNNDDYDSDEQYTIINYQFQDEDESTVNIEGTEEYICDHSCHPNRLNKEYIMKCTDLKELSCIEIILRQKRTHVLSCLIAFTKGRLVIIKIVLSIIAI